MAGYARGWRRTAFWLGTAGGGLIAAGLFSPARVLSRLDGPAERFREELAQGIDLVRLGLVAVAVLALASLAWWRDEEAGEPAGMSGAHGRADCWLVLGLFLLGAMLALPNLGGSFWWDELTSLSLVVKRGPAVILAYSCKANNHVLNSLGMWLAWRTFGASEVAIRMPALLLGAAIAPSLYLCVARRWGRGPAVLAGFLAVFHLTIASHSAEARGYAGAILASLLACACFASLLHRGRPLVWICYIASSLAAIGFVTTTILVPVAHGLVALWLAFRNAPGARAASRGAVFACLWVGVLALVLFGLPLPQACHYARTDAARDHLAFGMPLLQSATCYLTGSSIVPAAWFLLALSAWGWTSPRVDRRQALAFLGPVAAAAAWMLLPGALLSARFLCFLVPATVLGLSLALSRLQIADCRLQILNLQSAICNLQSAILFSVVVVWLAVTWQGQLRWQSVGNPDLKDLARRLQGRAIALVGSQADVNRHYFPRAALVKHLFDLLETPEIEFVIQGKVGTAAPDERLVPFGFTLVDRLDSALPGRTVYLIYGRDQAEARRTLGNTGSGLPR